MYCRCVCVVATALASDEVTPSDQWVLSAKKAKVAKPTDADPEQPEGKKKKRALPKPKPKSKAMAKAEAKSLQMSGAAE
eukprot:15475426-Alexandrium_andersonii.AAC.1